MKLSWKKKFHQEQTEGLGELGPPPPPTIYTGSENAEWFWKKIETIFYKLLLIHYRILDAFEYHTIFR